MKIKTITLQNFKGCKNETYIFDGKNTTVSGANATGKTTIVDAFWWLLFNKDSLGNEKFSIRPLDSNGKQIDNIEIKVSVTVDIDGVEKEFTKVQKQKWVKKRSSDVTELQGNENLYEIDGYPKSEKDYKTAISELVSEDVFKMLTNPVYFPNLKWKEQREVLMRFVKEVSDYDLASGEMQFAEILDELRKAPSTDDIKAKYLKALNEWKKKQAEIPVRIDEVEKSKVDIDVAELELSKKEILVLIEENSKKQEEIINQMKESEELSNGIMELKFKESDLIRKANEGHIKKRRELEDKISDKKFLLKNVIQTIKSTESIIQSSIEIKKKKELLLEDLRKQYDAVSKRKFDENSLICKSCGREYAIDKKMEIKAKFDENRSGELKQLTENGKKAKTDIDVENETLRTLDLELSEHRKSYEMLNTAISELENQLKDLPDNIDISDSEEIRDIQNQIVEKESQLEQLNRLKFALSDLTSIRRELDSKLTEIEKQIAKADKNIEIDERITELAEEQRSVAQKVADQEKILYLLEQFIRFKMDKVSSSINDKFDGINWKLFENQINGGLKETCELTVNGVPYGSLNAGHRIVAGLQIIKALQTLYGVYMPIFIDNAESVNNFNLPTMNCQMILLKVSEDKELKVEV